MDQGNSTAIDVAKARDVLSKKKGRLYDVLLMFSGGKDSCYLAKALLETGRYRILLFTCNNGYLSSKISENIAYFCKKTNLEQMIFSPPTSLLSTIYRCVLHNTRKEWYQDEMCDYCTQVMLKSALLLACNYHIPYIVTGHDPTQYIGARTPIRRKHLTGFIKFKGYILNEFDSDSKRFLNTLYKEVRKAKLASYLFPWRGFPQQISLFGIIGYNYDTIIEEMTRYGLPHVNPKDTNCLVDALAVELQYKKNGRFFYERYIHEMVRRNMLSKERALNILRDWEEEARNDWNVPVGPDREYRAKELKKEFGLER